MSRENLENDADKLMTEIGEKENNLEKVEAGGALDKSVEITAEVSSRKKESITNEFLSRIYASQV